MGYFGNYSSIQEIKNEFNGSGPDVYEFKNHGFREVWYRRTNKESGIVVDVGVLIIAGKAPELLYKPLSVEVHPYYYGAPEKWVLEYAFESEGGKRWREKYFEVQAKKRETKEKAAAFNPQPGEVYTVYGKKYTIAQPYKNGFIGRGETGREYYIKSKQFDILTGWKA
jgi:hypothetical protein